MNEQQKSIKYAKNLLQKLEALQQAFPGKVHGLRNQYAKIDLAISLAEQYGQYDHEYFTTIINNVEAYIINEVLK